MKFRASAISKPGARAPGNDSREPVSRETRAKIISTPKSTASPLYREFAKTRDEICEDVLAAQEEERLLRAWLVTPRTASNLQGRLGIHFLDRLKRLDAEIVYALGSDDGLRLFYWIKTERDQRKQVVAFGTYDINTGAARSIRDRPERGK